MKRIILGILALLIMPMFVSATVVYNSIDTPLPGSYPSVGYEATSTFELGDDITLDATGTLSTVTVTLTNWACENDFTWTGSAWTPNRATTAACVTTPGSTFNHPITLNIYNVNNSGANASVGSLITTKTVAFNIPYRPSYDASSSCTAPGSDVPFGGRWYDPVTATCVHGYNYNAVFDFSLDGVVLPSEVIISVAYNTANYGANPIGAPGPYSSLNYGLSIGNTLGIDEEPATVFMKSTWGGAYCDSGVSGTGTFRRDADCWSGYVPTLKVEIEAGNEVPEFGLIAGIIALAGLVAGVTVLRKRD